MKEPNTRNWRGFEGLTESKNFLKKYQQYWYFASNDFLALAIIEVQVRLNVPGIYQSLADGIEVGLMVEPSLATISTEPKILGAGAGKTVLSLIDKTSAPSPPSQIKHSISAPAAALPTWAQKGRRWKGQHFSIVFDPTTRK